MAAISSALIGTAISGAGRLIDQSQKLYGSGASDNVSNVGSSVASTLRNVLGKINGLQKISQKDIDQTYY